MAIFFQKWLTTSRSWLILLRPIFRDDFFFLFRINFKGIFVHYSKNRLLEGDFATCPHPSRSGCLQGLPPVGAVPSPQGLPPTPGAVPSPRGLPPAPDFSVVGAGGSPSPPAPGGWGQPPGAGGCLSPRGLRQSPFFGGSPQKSQPPRKIDCVWGGFLETLLFLALVFF